jgi:beta-glucosidase
MFDQGRYVFEIGASSRDIKGQVEALMSGTYRPVLKTVVAECDRVVLRPGNTVQTSVTAAMSDDSFYPINNAEVTYKSNNPSVASVDASGKVTATGVGTALIFAYVTVDGATVSNSYPLKVMPDLTPEKITLNGKVIKGYAPEVKAYSFLLKDNSKIPVVQASARGRDIAVEIEQVKKVPGTAVIDFIDNITLETNTYYLNFDTKSVSDEFNGSLGDQWEWVRENPANHTLSKNAGSLTFTSEAGDLSEASNNAKNILLQSANSDWTIETKLGCSRTPSQPENAGILVYENDEYFVKLMFRAAVKRTRFRRTPGSEVQPGTIDLIMEENGLTKSIASVDLMEEITGDNALILKLGKKGSLYTASYSLDGGNYETLGTADILLKDIRAGLIVCDGVITQNMKSTFWFNPDTTKPETPFDVSFDYFRIENNGLK